MKCYLLFIKENERFELSRGQNPPDGFQDRSLQPDLGNSPYQYLTTFIIIPSLIINVNSNLLSYLIFFKSILTSSIYRMPATRYHEMVHLKSSA